MIHTSELSLFTKNTHTAIYLTASQQCDGIFIGNAEVIPFSPHRYLYQAYMAYMRANGLSKPVSLTRFGTDMPGAMAKYGKAYLSKRSIRGHMRSNLAGQNSGRYFPNTATRWAVTARTFADGFGPEGNTANAFKGSRV